MGVKPSLPLPPTQGLELLPARELLERELLETLLLEEVRLLDTALLVSSLLDTERATEELLLRELLLGGGTGLVERDELDELCCEDV